MSIFIPPKDRDTYSIIWGYVYQVDLTIERWINLQPGQILEVERGEDIDTISRSLTETPEEQKRLLEQRVVIKMRLKQLLSHLVIKFLLKIAKSISQDKFYTHLFLN